MSTKNKEQYIEDFIKDHVRQQREKEIKELMDQLTLDEDKLRKVLEMFEKMGIKSSYDPDIDQEQSELAEEYDNENSNGR